MKDRWICSLCPRKQGPPSTCLCSHFLALWWGNLSPGEKEQPIHGCPSPAAGAPKAGEPHLPPLFLELDVFEQHELPSNFLRPHPSRLSQVQLLNLRLGDSIGSGSASLCQACGLPFRGKEEEASLGISSSVGSLMLHEADPLPQLVQFSLCMLYSSEPLRQGGERSTKGKIPGPNPTLGCQQFL